ncbi:porin [Phenylobacterium sp. LjRoot219]|uniref:hypothetical protein n=1 Tax=Phenylobacterium sp. LjRoot219 TaxID=3342283 RepID=UPI003ED0B7CB
MRTFLIATVATAALFGAASAQAQVVGHAGVNYAYTDGEVAGFDYDADAFQLEGAAAFKLGGLGAQVDGSFTDSDDMDAVWSATGHLNGDLGGALVGGFAGFSTTDDDTLWGVGAEAQADLAASTVLYGQVGYGQIDDVDADLWAVRGELRHYFAENIRLSGSIGYVNVDAGPVDADNWTFGVEGEYQFASTPYSLFAGYQRVDGDADVEANVFQVGARYTFGGATLRGRDAAGAMLGGVNKLFGLGN